MTSTAPARAGRARWEHARRVGADLAHPELWDVPSGRDTGRISVEEAAVRLGVRPSTVRGYLRPRGPRPPRLEGVGGGVSAASVDAYAARRQARPGAH